MTQTVTETSAKAPFERIRGRAFRETLTAYAFLLPAALLIFIFEFFPVSFAFFVSLHDWRRFPDEFIGLEQYYDALGTFAFVLFFWLAIGGLAFALWQGRKFVQLAADAARKWLYALPGLALAFAALGFINWLFTVLLFIMEAAQRTRGQVRTNEVFLSAYFDSFTFPESIVAAQIMFATAGVAAIIVVLTARFNRVDDRGKLLLHSFAVGVFVVGGIWLMRLTLDGINLAILEAREDGEMLPIWTQIIVISAGAGMIALAAWQWQRVVGAETDRGFIVRGLLVALLVAGGVLLIRELPIALAEADDDVLNGFGVAIMYSAFSIPIQLAIGLLLAILLFQNIRLKQFFRVVFFMPYITPLVATSVVFALLFGPDPQSPLNQFLAFFGIDDQLWLLEGDGIFQLLLGDWVPDLLAGPGLALVVIIIFGIWTFAGYSTVIFLAGLGNIETEFYEAAEVDGANSWHKFRHITLPLLSPTTFFLILITTIGTLQAFTQFFLMRRPGAYDAVDTINIHIFNEVRTDFPDFAYGSAMAFVLFGVILVLTVIQNRIIGRKVFYG